MAVKLPNPIEILATGTRKDKYHRTFTFGEDDLQKMVAEFANYGSVPLVVGHPPDDKPEMGKGTKLEVRGGRLVVAEAEDLDPTFQRIVNTGELSSVSVKLAPHGDTYRIKHVGFHGKTPVAWEELTPAQFSAADEPEILFTSWEAEPVTVKTTETAGATDTRDAEFAARQATLDQKEAAFAARQAEFQRAETIRPFLRKLEGEGRILPGEVAPLEALFSKFDNELEIEFSKGEGQSEKVPGLGYLKTFLQGLPKRVDYTEVAGGEGPEFSAGKTEDPATQRRKAVQKTLIEARK